MSIDVIRKEFEVSIYEEYKTDILRQQLSGEAIDLKNKTDFFKMRPNGQYFEAALEFAFMGYNLGVRDAIEANKQVKPIEAGVVQGFVKDEPVVVWNEGATIEKGATVFVSQHFEEIHNELA